MARSLLEDIRPDVPIQLCKLRNSGNASPPSQGKIPLAVLIGCQAFSRMSFQLRHGCNGWGRTDGKHSFESWSWWFLWRVLQHIAEFYQIVPWMGCLQNACKDLRCVPNDLGTHIPLVTWIKHLFPTAHRKVAVLSCEATWHSGHGDPQGQILPLQRTWEKGWTSPTFFCLLNSCSVALDAAASTCVLFLTAIWLWGSHTLYNLPGYQHRQCNLLWAYKCFVLHPSRF